MFRQMWDAGAPAGEIAGRFGVSISQVYIWRREYRIADRSRKYLPKAEPTLDEIEQRKTEIRSRNMERLRLETAEQTIERVRREKRVT